MKFTYRSQNGSAVIVILALLAIVLTYVGFNLVTLRSLDREVELVEKRQLIRLQRVNGLTNSAPSTNLVGIVDRAAPLQWTVSPPSKNR